MKGAHDDTMRMDNLAVALRDLHDGFFSGLWLYLAWQDIRQRYRRSLIGPFWLTISTGVMVAGMGPLYGALLKQDVGSYLQHLTVSLVVWSFIAGYINESCTAFIGAESFIKQVQMPLTTHLLRVLARNFIMFSHSLVVVVVVLVLYPPENLGFLPLTVAGLALLLFNLAWIGLTLATVCARFRDIPQIVASIVQVAFFLTPIVWRAEMLGRDTLPADLNPLYHLLEILRAPILGYSHGATSWLVALGLGMVGCVASLALFCRFRSRIAFWV